LLVGLNSALAVLTKLVKPVSVFPQIVAKGALVLSLLTHLIYLPTSGPEVLLKPLISILVS